MGSFYRMHSCVSHTIHSSSIRNPFEWRTFQRFVFILTCKRRTVWHNADANDEHIKATFLPFTHTHANVKWDIIQSFSLKKERNTHTLSCVWNDRKAMRCYHSCMFISIWVQCRRWWICFLFVFFLSLSHSRWRLHIIRFAFSFVLLLAGLKWSNRR